MDDPIYNSSVNQSARHSNDDQSNEQANYTEMHQ